MSFTPGQNYDIFKKELGSNDRNLGLRPKDEFLIKKKLKCNLHGQYLLHRFID